MIALLTQKQPNYSIQAWLIYLRQVVRGSARESRVNDSHLVNTLVTVESHNGSKLVSHLALIWAPGTVIISIKNAPLSSTTSSKILLYMRYRVQTRGLHDLQTYSARKCITGLNTLIHFYRSSSFVTTAFEKSISLRLMGSSEQSLVPHNMGFILWPIFTIH